MGLKDMVSAAANSTMNAAQEALQGASEKGASGIMQGMLGNYSEMTLEAINEQYGMYLMDGESFTQGFALLRDKLLFTDKRIIFIDHQGATGQKVAIESINLRSIVSVYLETSGMGFDHAEITFEYITSPYYKAHNVQTDSKKLEFPKDFDVQPLYCMLEGIAYSNIEAINS